VLRRVAVRAGRPHPWSRRLLDLPVTRRTYANGCGSPGLPTFPSRWSPKRSGRSSGHSRPAFVTSHRWT
jgi:hypothetical protein